MKYYITDGVVEYKMYHIQRFMLQYSAHYSKNKIFGGNFILSLSLSTSASSRCRDAIWDVISSPENPGRFLYQNV